MKTLVSFLFFFVLSPLQADPPQVLQLPPSVMCAGTTTTIEEQAWAYLVWNANEEEWYEENQMSVFLSIDDGTTFTRRATMGLLTDPAAIAPWISRAVTLGEDLQATQDAAEALFIQWRESDEQEPPGDLAQLLSILANRASQESDAAGTLRQIGQSSLLFRFLTGTGWGGAIGVANGAEAIFELRNQDGEVMGRVVLTAGENPVLSAPGAPVHVVPDYPTTLPIPSENTLPVARPTTQIDRSISLRWAVPEALRPQLLLTRGFYLWRLSSGYTPPGGLNGAALLAAEGNGQVIRVSESPIVASKMYRPEGSAESGPDVTDLNADRDTWFMADDNRRFEEGGVPFTEGDSFDYVVAPVDLLGRVGMVSPRGQGTAARFIPPTVPDVHRVENTMVEGEQRLRVVWRANDNDLPEEASATHYLLFRGRVGNTEMQDDAIALTSNPNRHDELIYLGVVPHEENGAMMSFVDTALVPQADDFGQPYVYSIRAAHLGPLGYVISTPSPAVLGTLRDRVGLPAPMGHPRTDCPRVGIRALDEEARVQGGWRGQAGRARIRLRCHRGLEDGRFDDVSWVIFGVSQRRLPGTTFPNAGTPGVLAISRALFFGNGDRVQADLVIPPGQNLRADILAVHSSGLVSHFVSSDPFTIRPGLDYEFDFRAISAPIMDMVPVQTPETGVLHEYWRPYFEVVEVSDVEDAGPQVLRANFPGAVSEVSRFLLIQRLTEQQSWVNHSAARIMPGRSDYVIPKAEGENIRYRAWLIQESPFTRDPADCPHEARPPGKDDSTVPIGIVLTLPIGTKEYRIYRRINDGDLALLDQSTEGWDDTKVETIIFEDGLIPPAGGRIGYYGQVFDEHGNPSPLALLDERILAMSQLPKPLLEKIEPGGTPQNPTMLLRALCPSPGVARLEFIITPEAEDIPAGLTVSPKLPSEIANFSPGDGAGAPAQTFSQTYAGPTDYHRDTSEPVILEAEVPIVRGQEYQVTALAIGLNGQVGDEKSAKRTFTWTPPLQGSLVPWPARPLPLAEKWHAELRAFQLQASHLLFSENPLRLVATQPASYPVAIRIGRLPMGNALPRSNSNPTSQWNVWGLAFNDVSVVGSFGLFRPPGFGASLPDELFHQYLYLRQIPQGEFVMEDPDSDLFPFVVYRQQIAREVFGEDEETSDTDIVQVSHMVRDIVWDSNLSQPRPDGEQTPPDQDFAFITDPYIGATLTNPGQVPLRADLCFFDNSPVTNGATYQYYFLHFDQNGEPDSVINAGTVKIGPSIPQTQ